jgi:uncharacterized NAD(P)/FAD-binding protein YdhS
LREQFLPRRVYGDYIQGLLYWHTKCAPQPHACIESIDARVLDLVPSAEHVAVVVEQRPTIAADKVILATGNPPPADVQEGSGEFNHPRYITNPWKPLAVAALNARDDVLLIGAGLTMIDAFLTLSSMNWQGKIYAVSRTGLLPLPHFHGIAYPDFPEGDPTTLGLDGLERQMREHCRRLRERGENPAIVVDRLRPYTQRVWQNLTIAEKTRFCREQRTQWNVIRHRIAQPIHEQLTAAQAAGKLQILQGQIRAMAGAGERIRLTIAGAKDGLTTLEAGLVINCTGPQESYRNSQSLLFQNLFDRGLVQADDMDMGIKAGADFGVIDGGGYKSESLFAIGPMLKGSLWETTAVPELRIQALRVAETILALLEGEAAPEWFAEMWVDVVEYAI